MGKVSSFFKNVLSSIANSKPLGKYTSAVILAGGSSTRMGEGVSKQLLKIDGIPVIVHTLLAFEVCEAINEIIVVAKKDELPIYELYKKDYSITKITKIVPGGETRQQSAAKGFAEISDKADYVAIHDGARCLVTPEEIERVCAGAYSCGAATAAARATDTVKIAKSGLIKETVDRENVWLAQTPQVFGANIYRAALAMAEKDGISVTDDCSMVEHIDYRIKLIECSKNNLKITTVDDIPLTVAIFKSRKQN